MKRVYITTIAAALLVLAVFSWVYSFWTGKPGVETLKVGFIYDNDESTPYTYNFMLAQHALEKELGDQVKIYTRSNVADVGALDAAQELVEQGCKVIFTNNYSDEIVEAAALFPETQFCQNGYNSGSHENNPANYHTFNGTVYQGRYVTGVAAGMKVQDLIDNGAIAADEAVLGYVGAFPSVEVVSGYTAFLLGVRSVVPSATMRVRYTGAWSSYSREKAAAKALIDEGCVLIAQHTDTIGPAVACEESVATRRVYHVGYNQNMIDIAPNTSLISTRVNWTPYVVAATQAVLEGKEIEKNVPGSVHGNDVSAGLDLGWVEVLELNRQLAAYGTEERLSKTVEALRKGTLEVFKGNYIGVGLADPADTIDLSQGFKENETTSWPTFGYLLTDIITVEE